MPDPIDYSGRLKDLLQEPYANSPELRSIYRDVGKGLATSGNKFVDITQRLGNLLGLGAIQDIEGSIDFFKQSQSKDVGKLLGELLQSGSQLVPPGRFARGLRQAGLPTLGRVLEGEGRAVEGYLPKEAREAGVRDLMRNFPISAESPVELDLVRDLAEHFLLRKAAVDRPPSSPFQVRDVTPSDVTPSADKPTTDKYGYDRSAPDIYTTNPDLGLNDYGISVHKSKDGPFVIKRKGKALGIADSLESASKLVLDAIKRFDAEDTTKPPKK